MPGSAPNNCPDAFVPCAASSNDHTYTYTHHCESLFDEAFIGANLDVNHCVPPSALLLESAIVPFSSPPSSPRTECWGKLDNGVSLKLQVEEIPGDCSYSVKNKQYHVRAKGKFAVTALITGIISII